MIRKIKTCSECGASFIPTLSNRFCDQCYKKLSIDLEVNTSEINIKSVEDEIYDRRFRK